MPDTLASQTLVKKEQSDRMAMATVVKVSILYVGNMCFQKKAGEGTELDCIKCKDEIDYLLADV